MPNAIVDIALSFGEHWVEDRRIWRIPHYLSERTTEIRLWINGVEIQRNNFRFDGGVVTLLDRSLGIVESTKVVAQLSLRKEVKSGAINEKVLLALVGIIPAVLTFITTIYVTHTSAPEVSAREKGAENSSIGRPLAAHEELYPVVADSNGQLTMDINRFIACVRRFLVEKNPRACADLIYLGESNNVALSLSETERALYYELIEQSGWEELQQAETHKDLLFQVYRDIVSGIGETFSHTPIEIVLHDTRNPLRSIVAVKNPISGRRIGDPITNFGLELIKSFSTKNWRGSNFVSYPLTLSDGRSIKSTTIPLFHNTYGLVGFVCVNFDISQLLESLKGDDYQPLLLFVSSLCSTRSNSEVSEMIENSQVYSPGATNE